MQLLSIHRVLRICRSKKTKLGAGGTGRQREHGSSERWSKKRTTKEIFFYINYMNMSFSAKRTGRRIVLPRLLTRGSGGVGEVTWGAGVAGGGSVVGDNWGTGVGLSKKAGFNRSMQTVSRRPLISKVKCFESRDKTLWGPVYTGWRGERTPSTRTNTWELEFRAGCI